MKNKDSKARMQMIFGILLFAFIFMAELYAMVNFPKMFIVLAVLAVADLICLYVAINGIISVYETKYTRREEQYESIFKSEKASYLMLKKYFEEISVKLAYMEEASKIPTEEIVNAQKGIAKVIIKRSHENTDALMNSYEQLLDRFDTFQKGMDGFGTVAGAYKDEILSVCKDEISSVQKDGKEQEHSQDKEIAAKLQEIIIAMKDMELRLNQTIMNSQKVVVSQPQVSVPVATPVEPAGTAESCGRNTGRAGDLTRAGRKYGAGTGDFAGSGRKPGTGDFAGSGRKPGTGNFAGSGGESGTGDFAGAGRRYGTGDSAGYTGRREF